MHFLSLSVKMFQKMYKLFLKHILNFVFMCGTLYTVENNIK